MTKADSWEEDDDYAGLATGIGSLIPIGGYIIKKKLYRRPIGFLADIDTLIDDDGNELRLQKVPLKPGKDKRALGSKQGSPKAGEGGPGKKGRREGSRPQRRKSEQRIKIKFAGPVPPR